MAEKWPDIVERLVSERGRHLFGYAFMLTGNGADAEDLVQSALIKVFSRSRRTTALHEVEAYVRRAIYTLFLDHRRGKTRRPEVFVDADATHAGGASGVESRLTLAAALAELSPRERACVVLRFYEGLSAAAIAVELDLMPGTVRKYLSTGIDRLGDILGDLGLTKDDALAGGEHEHIRVTVR